ncbi:MAG: hypothetical protein HQL15_10060, partial [Candidatus Omnitrophica bacterium]|nr:hypothetical protein [Candidatus Omnitrophota bacterium]
AHPSGQQPYRIITGVSEKLGEDGKFIFTAPDTEEFIQAPGKYKGIPILVKAKIGGQLYQATLQSDGYYTLMQTTLKSPFIIPVVPYANNFALRDSLGRSFSPVITYTLNQTPVVWKTTDIYTNKAVYFQMSVDSTSKNLVLIEITRKNPLVFRTKIWFDPQNDARYLRYESPLPYSDPKYVYFVTDNKLEPPNGYLFPTAIMIGFFDGTDKQNQFKTSLVSDNGVAVFDLTQIKPFFKSDKAMITEAKKEDSTPGGIDFDLNKVKLETGNSNGEIRFHPDAATLLQLQNASVFTPQILNLQPVTDLKVFLGLNNDSVQTHVS